MENVLQALVRQYTQQLALVMATIAVVTLTASVITEAAKEIDSLRRIPTAMQVIVLSITLYQLVYWWYVTSIEVATVWWGPVLAPVVAFYMAFLAMYSWEKLARLWARYRHPGGSI